MDILTTITTALIAGATSALKDTANKSIKDAYAGLKNLITNKIKNKNQINDVIKKMEKNPRNSEPALKSIITESNIINDNQIFAQAESLLKLIYLSSGNTIYKQNIHVNGGVENIVTAEKIDTLNINRKKD